MRGLLRPLLALLAACASSEAWVPTDQPPYPTRPGPTAREPAAKRQRRASCR